MAGGAGGPQSLARVGDDDEVAVGPQGEAGGVGDEAVLGAQDGTGRERVAAGDVVEAGRDRVVAGLGRVGAPTAALPGLAGERHQLEPAVLLPQERPPGVARADGVVVGSAVERERGAGDGLDRERRRVPGEGRPLLLGPAEATTVSSSPGAGAVVANGTGVVPATGEARRARTRSRSVRGTSSTTSTVVPAAGPRTAVVLHCGLPAATGPAPRSSAKQLAAVASHWAATSTPEQARWSSPMRRRAVEAWPPSVTAGPVAAWTGPTTRQPAATAMAVRPAVTAARERNLDTGRYSVLSGGGMTGGRSTDDMGIRQDEDAPRRARPSRRSAEHGPAHLDGARKQPCPRQARRPPPSSLPAPLARRPRTYHHVHNSNTASTSSR